MATRLQASRARTTKRRQCIQGPVQKHKNFKQLVRPLPLREKRKKNEEIFCFSLNFQNLQFFFTRDTYPKSLRLIREPPISSSNGHNLPFATPLEKRVRQVRAEFDGTSISGLVSFFSANSTTIFLNSRFIQFSTSPKYKT